ncbi:MAG TPA: polysaccharide biosynthesis protein [Psychromonas hadalis]|nr:polysaccharide biosynthesis protein [Psychromonas hadalis]
MINPLRHLLATNRKNKRVITVIYDVFAVSLSLYLAISLRMNNWQLNLHVQDTINLVLTIAVTIYIFTQLGMYRAVMRYMTLPALGHIFIAVILSALTLTLSSFFFQTFIPKSMALIYVGFATLLLGGPRVLMRTFYYHYYKKNKPNVFIYGAGATGRSLANILTVGNQYNPVVLLDDNPEKIGQITAGLRVHPSSEFAKLKSLYQPVKLLIAINNIGKGERLRLIEKLSKWPIEIQSVPSIEDIASGKASIEQIQDLNLSDLLGRMPIEPNKELLSKNIKDKQVLVTGAGGSIGAELCRQIMMQSPSLLVLFELNEYNLYAIDQELNKLKTNYNFKVKIISTLGSVQKKNRLINLMKKHEIQTVFHAAAYKHVPLVEDNIIEGIRNNVFGTLYVAEAAISANVSHFTLISTDKAVRPTNIMGASKRLAELVLQSLVGKEHNTTFTMVRFGNVLGSSGSVVPFFKDQIKKGGPVTVTHPEINRFFMLIPEAAQLVIQAGAMAKNGQVFVLDMGNPVYILALAKRMIHLMGFTEKEKDSNEDGDIEICFTGLRPGEKLYEELLIADNVEGTTHPRIMTAKEDKLTWNEMAKVLTALDEQCKNYNSEEVKQIIIDSCVGYQPKQSQSIIKDSTQ